jgi:hypothetical protein
MPIAPSSKLRDLSTYDDPYGSFSAPPLSLPLPLPYLQGYINPKPLPPPSRVYLTHEAADFSLSYGRWFFLPWTSRGTQWRTAGAAVTCSSAATRCSKTSRSCR